LVSHRHEKLLGRSGAKGGLLGETGHRSSRLHIVIGLLLRRLRAGPIAIDVMGVLRAKHLDSLNWLRWRMGA
jgi:hypothetical protein